MTYSNGNVIAARQLALDFSGHSFPRREASRFERALGARRVQPQDIGTDAAGKLFSRCHMNSGGAGLD
jgi:hypothetical protein